NGIRFSETSILSNVTADSNLPGISATGNNVYVAWEDDSSENSRILFRGSHNNGRGFDKIVDISNGTIGSSLQNIASYKNFVYIVWVGSKPEDPKNFEVFLRKSNDHGRNFGPIIDLSKSAGDSIDPRIVVPRDGQYVYVTYTDCEAVHDDPLCGIYFIKSSDSGIRFGSPTLISIVSSTNSNLPSLGHSHPPITSSLLPAFGMNTQKQIDEHNSIIPVITSSEDGKDVYVLWQDDLTKTGATDIFFRKSNDFGNTFGDSINLSNTPGISRLAQMVTLGGKLYVVWSDTNMTFDQFDIFFTRINDHGNDLGKTINLSNSTTNSAPSDIGVVNNSNRIYVAWTEGRGNNNNIFMTRSISDGDTFDQPTRLISNNSVNPTLIHLSNENSTGLSWSEYDNQTEELYFASKLE
ncbi:MAG TPA: hypothetical protein VL854_00035, partial [Nitrososphaeraceae archaeon]|nr:hypothetical protein [Nitrososphaeraceae archaeon]